MFWRKRAEVDLPIDRKKITLERMTVLGQQQRLNYIETIFPPPQDGASKDHVLSVTRCRVLWRYRIRHPIKTTFYKNGKDGTWQEIGTCIP